MSTTLITTIQGIGLGVMGQSLAENVSNISEVVPVKRNPQVHIDLKFPERFNMPAPRHEPLLESIRPDRKVLYIENSYNTAQKLHRRGQHTIYVPMWEQSIADLRYSTEVIAVTKHTQAYLSKIFNAPSRYLPWPVDANVPKRKIGRVRTILHNAGSLGGNYRKGTKEAIKIFQRSGLAKKNVRLVIHSWMPMPIDLAAVIHPHPEGIVWTDRFLDRHDDIYTVYEPDLLLMPSKIEGHALVALEAMARGVPTIVTDCAPINEYEQEPDYRIPISYWEKSPLASPYAIVDCDLGADRLAKICDRDQFMKSMEVRNFVETEMSWDTLRPQWEEVCA